MGRIGYKSCHTDQLEAAIRRGQARDPGEVGKIQGRWENIGREEFSGTARKQAKGTKGKKGRARGGRKLRQRLEPGKRQDGGERVRSAGCYSKVLAVMRPYQGRVSRE